MLSGDGYSPPTYRELRFCIQRSVSTPTQKQINSVTLTYNNQTTSSFVKVEDNTGLLHIKESQQHESQIERKEQIYWIWNKKRSEQKFHLRNKKESIWYIQEYF